MNFLIILFFFGVSSNVVLLLLSRFGFKKKLGDFLTIALAYGTGPLLFSLIFYASIYSLPAKEDIFYVSILVTFCIAIIILCKKNIFELKDIYFDMISRFIGIMKEQSRIVLLIALFFIGIYSIQLLAFPVINNDSVLYLNQSEAFYEYKNIDWQKKSAVIINGDDLYGYNPTIGPGIPSFNAATYLFQGKTGRTFFSFKFLIFYYYTLLLLFFLFTIKKTSEKVGVSRNRSMTYGLMFFVFSWGLSRMLIFSTKEVIIYFLALFSIYIASLLIDEEADSKNRFHLFIILAILLGINSFVNLHGIVIEALVILVLLTLSKSKIVNRVKEVGYILLLSLPFSGFEFLTYFNFIFVAPIHSLLSEVTVNIVDVLNNTDKLNVGILPPDVSSTTVVHQNLYQFHNTEEQYLKGKFQILTNIGSFGVYFWMYLVVVISYFKEILKNNLLKFLLLFTVIYYLVVIDPFNIIKHPLMIVLTGSQKYAMLLLFLSMIPASIFLDRIIQKIITFVEKYLNKFILAGLFFLFIVILFKKTVLDFGLKTLLATIAVFKDISFYRGTVEILYDVLIFIVILSVVILTVSVVRQEKKWITYLANILVVLVIIVPFFATNVGKVSLEKTFTYINKGTQFKLENSLAEADVFKVYFKAMKLLPKGTVLAVDFNELYAYDNYFALRSSIDSSDTNYLISANCGENNWERVISSNGVYLCERK